MTARPLPRINHVGVSVRTLEASTRFWVEGLGASVHGAFEWPVGTTPADESLATEGTAARVQLLRTDSAFMELFEFTSPAPQVRSPQAPGVRALVWGATDPDARVLQALAAGGGRVEENPRALRCPDGVLVHLIEVAPGHEGLRGVRIAVEDAEAFVFREVEGPVALEVASGAGTLAAAAVDLGVNHFCLDVHDAAVHRAGADEVRWHHEVTESSGGLAAVCYGTTSDGVLVELLESRSAEAFLARARLVSP